MHPHNAQLKSFILSDEEDYEAHDHDQRFNRNDLHFICSSVRHEYGGRWCALINVSATSIVISFA